MGRHFYMAHKQKRLASAQAGSVVSAAAPIVSADSNDAAIAKPEGSAAPSTAASTSGMGSSSNAGNTQPSAPAAAPVAPAPATAPASGILKLTVEAVKKTDVKIVGDGKVLFKGRMHSDSPKTFEAKDGFEVTAGEADRLKIELNGQKIPFAATNGRHGSISLDKKDLKAAAPSR